MSTVTSDDRPDNDDDGDGDDEKDIGEDDEDVMNTLPPALS